jgi:hypothetical protein
LPQWLQKGILTINTLRNARMFPQLEVHAYIYGADEYRDPAVPQSGFIISHRVNPELSHPTCPPGFAHVLSI